jgi:hypothetical protein
LEKSRHFWQKYEPIFGNASSPELRGMAVSLDGLNFTFQKISGASSPFLKESWWYSWS